MSCFWRTSDLAVLLIWGVFVAESSCINGNQTAQNSPSPLPEVNTIVSVQMGTKALLCCPDVSLTKAVLITWEIILRNQPSCRISYRVETKETNETNCTDRRITWDSTPDQSPDLQISAVALDHDGHYSCQIATSDGHFQERRDLQVLVPPEVTLSPGKSRTAVCEATAGKPAAQISWTPDGDCKTMNESHSNGTVTVRSTCQWDQSNVSAVFCFVSHLTGNQTLSIELIGGDKALRSYIPYVIPCTIIIIVLIITGCIWLLKISGFRKCKWTRPGASTVVEEDDMQPYASYTEKSNPLYDTVTKVEEACSMPQGEVNGTDWLALSATGI
ncbi:cell surface glycoprotein CD200 receptor 1 isoform X2 [Peromyscus californicus insignis]|uniref:cell surface glycoprotein CD200 receptor 1 isoform X2 n=1 Tax=Peromyscus californicus insignis TaxID=564181 RepID=UPI0022A6EEC0|nr:cell surface glycoprotein CD200 receptor 1 isoform X2 [Peromyscus californicus insignis]